MRLINRPLAGGLTNIKTNLVAWYDLDDATDAHGSLDLSLRSSGAYTAPAYVAGKVGNAVDLENANSSGTPYAFLGRASESALNITGALTLSAWVKLESLSSGNRGIVAKWLGTPSANRSYGLAISSDGYPVFFLSTNGSFEAGSSIQHTSAVSTGSWVHLVARFHPSSTQDLWRNGASVATNGSPPASIYSGAAELWVGCQYAATNSNSMDGMLDSVGIWSRALSDTEIIALYNGGDGLAYADLP